MGGQDSIAGLPAGWFQIAWSHEIEPGGVRPLRFFGEDLVLCRFESGQVGLFEAYCPHLSAHIGFGGSTIGETLVCPYHGWRFDGGGCNIHIPYSDRVNRAKGLRVWDVKEVGGALILAWFSPDGSPARFEAPDTSVLPGLTSPGFFPIDAQTSRRYADISMRVEFVSENTVDMSHFRFVHETPEVGTILELDPADHRLNVRFSMPMKLFRPDGDGEIVDSVSEVTNWGLGLILAWFADDSVLIQAQTPVDEMTCDLMLTMILARGESAPDELTPQHLGRVRMAWRQVENDLVIWSHRRAGAKQHLIAEEAAPFKTFSTWKRQFYPQGGQV